jgi:hydroxyethylthiazole kinase-like uncharacterized protein yjeF
VKRITPAALGRWPLPAPGDDKHARGNVVALGGAARSPGAIMLAGRAALRVGAGHLTVGVARSVAAQVAVAVPECGVIPLAETKSGHISGRAADAAAPDLARADAVLLGPGLDHPGKAAKLVDALPPLLAAESTVVLDAFALGALPGTPDAVQALRGRLILTPNKDELARLLDDDVDDLPAAVRTATERYGAVVTCYGVVAHPDGRTWQAPQSGNGLATSGSGDVLAGMVTGLAARGASPEQAAVWATWMHIEAGARLATRIAPIGYLASELLDELPALLAADPD